MTITITCAYQDCQTTTTGSFRIKSGRKYYDCPKCGRAMRLKKSREGGDDIPVCTGAKNRDMQLISIYLRRDILAELRKLPKYSDVVNSALAQYLKIAPCDNN